MTKNLDRLRQSYHKANSRHEAIWALEFARECLDIMRDDIMPEHLPTHAECRTNIKAAKQWLLNGKAE